jgi:ankyrin repeat domain-containing protein 50
MAHRRLDADRAYPNTCKWTLQHQSYLRWISQEHKLLWLKGKPGSGKSTSLAFIYRAYKNQATTIEAITLDFFFHGRGAPLQKTPEGMFRSLLHQVFTQCHSVRSPIRVVFKEKRLWGQPERDWRWHSRELEDLLSNAIIHAAKTHVITIFVDALDEAGAEAAHELVSYFHRLKENVVARQGKMKICVSCRHYPVIIRSPSLDICVEDENRDDISNYVQSVLRSEGLEEEFSTDLTNEWYALAKEVIDKASGIFQWARLVVPIITQLLREGESLSFIKQRLAEVPEALGEVYRHIIERVIGVKNRPRTLFMMQWICLAVRPLSVTQIRYAMATDCRDDHDHKSSHICKDAKNFIETDEHMTRLVTTLSGGLAEVKQHEIVQLIHQSVHDFLLLDGLRYCHLQKGLRFQIFALVIWNF